MDIEAFNKLSAASEEKDKKFDTVFQELEALLSSLDYECSDKSKILIKAEYLLTQLRILIEGEHIQVKRFLNSTNATVKAFFVKRDVYLSQISLKLNNIREDLNLIQKTLYLISYSFKN